MTDQDKILATKTLKVATVATDALRVAAGKDEHDEDHALKNTTLGHSLNFAQVDLSKFSAQHKEALMQLGAKSAIRTSDIEAGAAMSALMNPHVLDDVIDAGSGEKKKQAEAAASTQKLIDDEKQKLADKEKSIKAAEETSSMLAAVSRLAEEAVHGCKKVFKAAQQWFGSAIDRAKKMWDEFSFSDSVSNAWNSTKQAWNGSSIGQAVNAGIDHVMSFASHPVESIKNAIPQGVKDFVSHPMDSISSMFGGEPEVPPAQNALQPNPQRVSAPPQNNLQELSAKVKESSLQIGNKLAQNNIGKITDAQDASSAPHVAGQQRSAGGPRMVHG